MLKSLALAAMATQAGGYEVISHTAGARYQRVGDTFVFMIGLLFAATLMLILIPFLVYKVVQLHQHLKGITKSVVHTMGTYPQGRRNTEGKNGFSGMPGERARCTRRRSHRQ